MNKIVKVETTNDVALTLYTPDQISLIKNTICQGATDNEYQLFMYQCTKTGLDPLAKQIYAIKRWDNTAGRQVMGIQTSIDGFRLIAERSGKYSGQLGPFWCGEDGVWMDVWTSSEPPAASKVAVLRHDFTEPCWGVARFSGYSQTKKNGEPTHMWNTKGDIMIAKCAEALALRKAFPQELSGLYTGDEMDQANQSQEKASDVVIEQTKSIEAPKKTWRGPLDQKTLRDKVQDFNTDLKDVQDTGSYEKLKADAQELIDQAEHDWAAGFDRTEENIKTTIERLKEIEDDFPFENPVR